MVYECSVMGGTFTVYDGAAFQCFSREIVLRNSAFGNNMLVTEECNSAQINLVGYGLSTQDNCFISRLNVTLEEGVMATTIACGVDDGLQLTSVGTATVAVSTGINALTVTLMAYHLS